MRKGNIKTLYKKTHKAYISMHLLENKLGQISINKTIYDFKNAKGATEKLFDHLKKEKTSSTKVLDKMYKKMWIEVQKELDKQKKDIKSIKIKLNDKKSEYHKLKKEFSKQLEQYVIKELKDLTYDKFLIKEEKEKLFKEMEKDWGMEQNVNK